MLFDATGGDKLLCTARDLNYEDSPLPTIHRRKFVERGLDIDLAGVSSNTSGSRCGVVVTIPELHCRGPPTCVATVAFDANVTPRFGVPCGRGDAAASVDLAIGLTVVAFDADVTPRLGVPCGSGDAAVPVGLIVVAFDADVTPRLGVPCGSGDAAAVSAVDLIMLGSNRDGLGIGLMVTN